MVGTKARPYFSNPRKGLITKKSRLWSIRRISRKPRNILTNSSPNSRGGGGRKVQKKYGTGKEGGGRRVETEKETIHWCPPSLYGVGEHNRGAVCSVEGWRGREGGT